MDIYRFYVMDEDGRVCATAPVDVSDDEDAKQACLDLFREIGARRSVTAVTLWQGDRLVLTHKA